MYTVLLNDPLLDLTADVLKLEWRLGFMQPGDALAAPISARVTVRSPTGLYAPERTPGLEPGRPLTIHSTVNAVTRTHFTGFIDHVEPLAGEHGQRTAVIHARGPEPELAGTRVRLPAQVNVEAAALITQVLDLVPLRRAVMTGIWLLDTPDHAELGTNTTLPGETIARSLQTGRSVFEYAADTWADGISALDAVREAAESERGRFYIDREGRAVFLNRHHTLLQTTSLSTFDENMSGLEYRYGADLVTAVQLRIRPRAVGAADSTLWTLGSVQRIPAGENTPVRVLACFTDAAGIRTGALTVTAPVRGVDYSANSQPDGSGIDLTNSVDVLLRDVSASAALLDVRNRSGRTVYLLATARLRGTPLAQAGMLLVEQIQPDAAALYGVVTLALDLPLLGSLEEAEQLARFELARRARPRGRVRVLTLEYRRHGEAALARTLFDWITVSDGQTGHSGAYFIVAEQHTVDLGGMRHSVRWLLEPADPPFWLLGLHALDQETVAGY